MTSLERRAAPHLTVLTWVALAALAAVVLALGVALLDTVPLWARQSPEFADVETLVTVDMLVVGVCSLLALAIVALLVAAVNDGRIFDRASLRLVDLLVGTIAVVTLTLAGTLPFLPGPPAVGLVVLGGALTTATLALVLLVLRALLRRATAMEDELAEVV